VRAQQVGQVGEQQVDARQADIGEQRGIAVDADVGQAGGLTGVDRTLCRRVHQSEEVGAVEQAGDQVLAADLAQFLFQLGVAALRADHHLDARLTIIGGRGKAHLRGEALAVGLDPGTGQLGVAFDALVVFQKVLEAGLVAATNQVDHRHAFQLVGIFIGEEFEVGAVGVDMHAVVHIGDGIDGAVEEQLAALLRFAQGDFGGAAGAAFLQIGQLARGHQHQTFVLTLRQGVLGTEHQGFGDAVGIVVGQQLDNRDVLGQAANAADGLAGRQLFAAWRADQQVPGLLQDIEQVIAGAQAMHTGRPARVAEQADQALGLVLRVFENQ
jgi:hypothetical protein